MFIEVKETWKMFAVFLSSKEHRPSLQARSMIRLWTLALLVVLAGCGNTPSISNTQPATLTPTHTRSATSTPLSLPPQVATATSTAPGSTSGDWTTYHHDNSRAGYVAGALDPRRLTEAWNVHLDGSVYAEPLVISGHVLVATENDSLYSLDGQTGQVLWRTNVGTPIPLSQLPCGNIDPLGITGTPVYDPATNLVFAVAETSGPSHILVGIDASSGRMRIRRPVEPGTRPIPSCVCRRHYNTRMVLLPSSGRKTTLVMLTSARWVRCCYREDWSLPTASPASATCSRRTR